MLRRFRRKPALANVVSSNFFNPQKLPLIFKFLNIVDVNGESTTGFNVYFPLFVAFPIVGAYIKAIQWTSESFGVFTSALRDWWNYSWVTVEMSNESVDSAGNLSRTLSDDDLSMENFTLTPLL